MFFAYFFSSLNLPYSAKSKQSFYLWLEMSNRVQQNQNQETLKSLFKGIELTSTCVVLRHGEAISEMALIRESQNAWLDCFKGCGQKLHTPANPPPVLRLFMAATEPAAALGGGRRLLFDEEQLAFFHHHVRHLQALRWPRTVCLVGGCDCNQHARHRKSYFHHHLDHLTKFSWVVCFDVEV